MILSYQRAAPSRALAQFRPPSRSESSLVCLYNMQHLGFLLCLLFWIKIWPNSHSIQFLPILCSLPICSNSYSRPFVLCSYSTVRLCVCVCVFHPVQKNYNLGHMLLLLGVLLFTVSDRNYSNYMIFRLFLFHDPSRVAFATKTRHHWFCYIYKTSLFSPTCSLYRKRFA